MKTEQIKCLTDEAHRMSVRAFEAEGYRIVTSTHAVGYRSTVLSRGLRTVRVTWADPEEGGV